MFYLDHKWLYDFLLTVPGQNAKMLTGMGLPVAGLPFEVRGRRVVFGNALLVDEKGNTYAFGRRVSKSNFTKIAVLITHYGEDFAKRFFEELKINNYKVTPDGKISAGSYVAKPQDFDEFIMEKNILGVKVKRGIPTKKFPQSVVVFDNGNNGIVYGFSNGVKKSLYENGVVRLLCWGMIVGAIYMPYDPLTALKKSQNYIDIKTADGWKICEPVEELTTYYGSVAKKAKVGVYGIRDVECLENIDAHIDKSLLASGWETKSNIKLFRIRRTLEYTKRSNSIKWAIHGNTLRLTFRNGTVIDFPKYFLDLANFGAYNFLEGALLF